MHTIIYKEVNIILKLEMSKILKNGPFLSQ